ncbi:MAG: glycosyl hydrolase [Acholeplasmataceae bacterium]
MTLPYYRAICYSGYRENQSPKTKTYPSYEEVLEDLTLLSKHYEAIRMYDPYDHAQTVLKVIIDNQLPLKVMLGVEPKGEISNPNCPWGGLHTDEAIKRHKKENYEQLDLLASLVNRYEDIVLAASVGNESTSDWHGNLMPPQTIALHATYLKQKINRPVTFCEGAYYYKQKGAVIADAVDFISIHSYPLWNKIPVSKAVDVTISDYQSTCDTFPNKQVIFTEYGWATKANHKMNAKDATEENQALYLKEMDRWSQKHQITMFTFEAFDEPWKGSDDLDEPEKHWGLYTVDRLPKGYAKATFK